jgi:hypothetical protein
MKYFVNTANTAANNQHLQTVSFLTEEGSALSLKPSGLCTIIGTLKIRSGSSSWFTVTKVIPFHTYLTEAVDIATTEFSHHRNKLSDLEDIEISHETVIEASKFPTASPLESISMQLLQGKYENSDVCLVKASYTFKSSSQLSICHPALKFESFDVIIDKIVLFDGEVKISKSVSDRQNAPLRAIPWKYGLLALFRGAEWNVYLSISLTVAVFWVFALSTSFLALALAPLFYIAFAGRGRLSDTVRSYLRADLRKNMSFFVNGWQAWSFCGAGRCLDCC